MDKGFEIADIIVAFIKGDATPEQIVRLDEWQNESDENLGRKIKETFICRC